MEKILCQTDHEGFFIGTTVHTWAGAIDTKEPEFDKETEKAKWVEDHWVIKSIETWESEKQEALEIERALSEERVIEQKKLEDARKITEFYEMAEKLGVKFEWSI